MDKMVEAGISAGSGFFGVLLTYLGFSHRLKTVENKFDHVVFKDVCEKCQQNQVNLGQSLKEDVSEMKQRQKDMDAKIDRLIERGR